MSSKPQSAFIASGDHPDSALALAEQLNVVAATKRRPVGATPLANMYYGGAVVFWIVVALLLVVRATYLDLGKTPAGVFGPQITTSDTVRPTAHP